MNNHHTQQEGERIMIRTTKASDVKVGMEIEFNYKGLLSRLIVGDVGVGLDAGCIWFYPPVSKPPTVPTPAIRPDYLVTVLAEAQPEEPTEFGAKARVRDGRFVRLDDDAAGIGPWHEKGTGYRWTWDDLCEMGPVTVVPDQGWTAQDDTPEVPDRIEEWPENDTALRAHGWLDRLGSVWRYENAGVTTGWSCPGMSPQNHPWGSPFTRVTDA